MNNVGRHSTAVWRIWGCHPPPFFCLIPSRIADRYTVLPALTQVETVTCLLSLAMACVRLHGLYVGQPGATETLSPVWPIVFIVADGFVFMSVAALAVTQASQVKDHTHTHTHARTHGRTQTHTHTHPLVTGSRHTRAYAKCAHAEHASF